MKGIEKKVVDQDRFIKSQAKKVREAIEKTITLEDIDYKMEAKLIRYLQKE